MAQRIDFYFDYLSPYAYLAWTQIHALAMDLWATGAFRARLLSTLILDKKLLDQSAICDEFKSTFSPSSEPRLAEVSLAFSPFLRSL